ncbi:ornithine carbamoyltransferase [Alteribacillus iranensis]|uniref:Ornithine carbamoyltransferase n=1 Tax=Alteribacillus iranensis TaxID=930128 RepID=A0A1I2CXL6_9BACI|nr:ornithine carbamoyltransferase [Alteribacillus iranensis]SFE73009.1 ornithine carbamoyltransferase [Alteribacillus iranensis]
MSENTRIDIPAGFQGRDILTLLDYTGDELTQLLEFAEQLKKAPYQPDMLQGKSLGMIFENASTRTRVSFEVGMTQLGGHALFLSPRDMQIGRGEPIKDTGHVLSRFLDAIMIRTNSHEMVEELASYAEVPVINALTDLYHPCQALADILTVKEQKGSLEGLKVTFVGDGNNVAHSLMIICAKLGMDAALAVPKGYEPDENVWKEIEAVAEEKGTKVELTHSPKEAVKEADVIYTDVWASMGYEEEQGDREKAFEGFQVSEELCSHAKEDFIFLHCLPAHRGEEVTSEIIDGAHSFVYDQAENRLHAQKAMLAAVIGG